MEEPYDRVLMLGLAILEGKQKRRESIGEGADINDGD
jgi:hypothetical protein